MLFPTQDGVVIIDPDEVPLPEAPLMALEAARVGEKMYPAKGPLRLNAREQDVVFVYTALSFFRQWAGLVPGAYRLFANLISLQPAEWRAFEALR